MVTRLNRLETEFKEQTAQQHRQDTEFREQIDALTAKYEALKATNRAWQDDAATRVASHYQYDGKNRTKRSVGPQASNIEADENAETPSWSRLKIFPNLLASMPYDTYEVKI